MKTPIYDFVMEYASGKTTRMHMPGHKGRDVLGYERFDITEIKGADSLYEADSIIRESEENASGLFECDTFYSAEGSSLCIRAMLYLVSLYAKESGKKMTVYAGRNALKTFVNTAAVLDLDVRWLFSKKDDSYLSFMLDVNELQELFESEKELPAALYITSPDYLGNTADIKAISEVCRKYGVLLLVDNAHGAYLKFFGESRHPIDLGADICCDSAHKTMAVLTGGAYLHVSPNAPVVFKENAKNALALFGSTSPSYLILQSLDKNNEYLAGGYRVRLGERAKAVSELKTCLKEKGYKLIGDEPMKIAVETKGYGYLGADFANELRNKGIECEFADPDYTVFMLSAENTESEINKLREALLSVERRQEIKADPPKITLPKKAMSIREATLSPSEKIEAKNALGRVLAFSDVGCPPAVPIVVAGEVIDGDAIKCFEYYGIDKVSVIK